MLVDRLGLPICRRHAIQVEPMEIGTCRLCLRGGQQLHDSHILPKWAYRHILGPPGEHRHPILIAGGAALPTALQIKQHLLCSDCEGRFAPHEQYVSTLAFSTGEESPLVDQILGQNKSVMVDGVRQWFARLASLNARSNAYFAASVFWRSHVASTRGSGTVGLGERYGEEFRRYLLAGVPFPRNATVHMAVLNRRGEAKDHFSTFITSPILAERDFVHRYNFVMCGLLFELFVGRQVPDSYRRLCLAHGGENVVTLTPPGQIGALQTVLPYALDAIWKGKPWKDPAPPKGSTQPAQALRSG